MTDKIEIKAEYIETDEIDGVTRDWYTVTGYCHQTDSDFENEEYAITSDGYILNGDGCALTEGDRDTIALHNLLG
jgi:hypothetical protein